MNIFRRLSFHKRQGPAISMHNKNCPFHTEYAGESLLLDPWGEDICHLEDDEDIAFGRVDTDVIHEVRSRINVFRDRRPDWDKVE